jgi:hypothetical protein
MKMKTGLFGRAMPFAHFAGLGGKKASEEDDKAPAGKTAAEDDDDTSAEDDDDKDSARAEGEDDAPGDDDDKSAEEDDDKARADDGDDDKDAEEDEPPPPKTKKAKAAKPVSADFRKGRTAERKRCARIFNDPAAARNPQAAATLAFTTGLSSSDAIAMLKTLGPGKASSRQNPDLGADRERTGAQPQTGKGWDRALSGVTTPRGQSAGSGWDRALGARR